MNNAIEKKEEHSSAGFVWMLLFAGLTVILWQIPYGRYILWPFTILGTWFHEMGHGLTAILLGGSLHSLELFPDGSGLARYSGADLLGGLGRAIVAAGGPLGPAIAGALLISLSRITKSAPIMLFALGATMLLSAILWLKTLFGFIFLIVLGILIIFIAFKGADKLRIMSVRLLGVQACVSVYLSVGYMFSGGGVIEGKEYLSDTAVMESALWLPYWFWGALLLLISASMIFLSLTIAYSKKAKPETVNSYDLG